MAEKTRDAGACTSSLCESVRIAEERGTIFVVGPVAGGQEVAVPDICAGCKGGRLGWVHRLSDVELRLVMGMQGGS
jgi:hypothetical protein